jgi:hypothetical protein
MAQSNPGWSAGTLPSAATWDDTWSSKTDINPVWSSLSSTISLTTNGCYAVTASGITITLPSLSLADGIITIKDLTGDANPDIMIVGTIDGNSGGLVIGSAYQSVTLCPSESLGTWLMI